MPSHKRHGPHRGGGHQPPPQPDVAAEAAEHAAQETRDGKKPGLNINQLKEMSIQNLTQVAKDLEALTGKESRHVVLGHLQRGGPPTSYDRMLATRFGIPVSTTHTITGSIVGVGATQRLSAVRWGLAGRIVWAWILTMPAAATMAAISYYLLAAIVRL